MMIKRIRIIITICMLNFICVYAQKDMVILRNGLDFQGQVVIVSNDKTVIKDTNGEQKEISNRDIYMIKYDKRGNVFFTESGERVSDNENDGKVPKGASAIYLIEGKEIIAYDISIDVSNVTYYPPVKKSLLIQIYGKSDTPVTISKNEVFLVRYQDGTKDLITDFETLKKLKEEDLAMKKARDEDAKREAWLKSFPKAATIITKKELVINAIILLDENEKLTYKRAAVDGSPIYIIDKKDVQDVFYKDSNYSAPVP